MTFRNEMIRSALVSALTGCCLALFAAPALAGETPAAGPEPSVAVDETGAAPEQSATAEPTAAAAASAPATPAQSGSDEYSEDGVPLGTGETEDPEPVEEEPEAAPAPTGSSPAPAVASEETPVATTGAELPRTGGATWLIALIASALIAAGVAVRRIRIAAPRG